MKSIDPALARLVSDGGQKNKKDSIMNNTYRKLCRELLGCSWVEVDNLVKNIQLASSLTGKTELEICSLIKNKSFEDASKFILTVIFESIRKQILQKYPYLKNKFPKKANPYIKGIDVKFNNSLDKINVLKYNDPNKIIKVIKEKFDCPY